MADGGLPDLRQQEGHERPQLSRMLGVSYKSTWFMMHRIREAMRDGQLGPIGGQNKVVEADETVVGGKAKNRAYKPEPKKHLVMSLVERDGRSPLVPHQERDREDARRNRAQKGRSQVVSHDRREPAYTKLGSEFAGHGTVNHSANEYARLGNWIHTNTVEGYFSIFKRGMIGIYHHVSEQHLTAISPSSISATTTAQLGVNDPARSEAAQGHRRQAPYLSTA